MYIDDHKHKTNLLNQIGHLENILYYFVFLEKITEIKEIKKKGLTYS